MFQPIGVHGMSDERHRGEMPSVVTQKLLQHQLDWLREAFAPEFDGRNVSVRFLASERRSKMSWCSRMPVTSALAASSMFLFSFADVSYQPVNPFDEQNASRNSRSTSSFRSHYDSSVVSQARLLLSMAGANPIPPCSRTG